MHSTEVEQVTDAGVLPAARHRQMSPIRQALRACRKRMNGELKEHPILFMMNSQYSSFRRSKAILAICDALLFSLIFSARPAQVLIRRIRHLTGRKQLLLATGLHPHVLIVLR